MPYAVEHCGLYGGVVYHILEYDVFAHLKLMVKLPIAHEVATQATVSAKTVSEWVRWSGWGYWGSYDRG